MLKRIFYFAPLAAAFLVVGILALRLWEPAPGPGSDRFLEGSYRTAQIGGSVGGLEFQFREGRFEGEDVTLTEGGYYKGSYERQSEPHGELITLTYDDPKHPQTVWRYRNFRGVSILVTKEDALATTDESSPRKLTLADFLVFEPGISDRDYYLRLLRSHPGFTKTLSKETLDGSNLSWWHYQRARFWTEIQSHEAVNRRIPDWLRRSLYIDTWHDEGMD